MGHPMGIYKSIVFQTALLGLLTTATSGCAEEISVPFDARQAQYILREGANTIMGRASLVSHSGHERSCSDSNVYLIPVTSYSHEWVARIFGSPPSEYGSRIVEEHLAADAQFEKFQRRATCDDAGNFRFDHVPDGQYYVFSTIYWLTRWQRNGGALLGQVTVSGDMSTKIILQHQS